MHPTQSKICNIAISLKTADRSMCRLRNLWCFTCQRAALYESQVSVKKRCLPSQKKNFADDQLKSWRSDGAWSQRFGKRLITSSEVWWCAQELLFLEQAERDLRRVHTWMRAHRQQLKNSGEVDEIERGAGDNTLRPVCRSVGGCAWCWRGKGRVQSKL